MLHPVEWHNRWGFLRPAAARISTRTSNNHIVEGKLKFSWEGKSWESVGEKQLSERENYDNTVCYTEPTLGGGKKSKEKKKNMINFMDGETNFLPDLASCEGEKGKTLFRRWLFFFADSFCRKFHCTLLQLRPKLMKSLVWTRAKIVGKVSNELLLEL